MAKPVIIVGAGASGLACAMTLKKMGRQTILIERASKVGGRIKTERSEEGFLFDRGFQVLLNSYPELPHFLDLTSLHLKNFNSGALIYSEDGNRLLANPLRHPQFALQSLFTDLADSSDKLRIPALLLKAMKATELRSLKGQTTFEFLKEFGFSERFISHFWKPFLTGVYLDPTLSLDANYFLFLLRSFSLGSVSIPAKGMEEIPKQMASTIDPESILLSARVSEIKPDHVKLENGDVLEGIVVQAFNTSQSEGRVVSTYYFAAAQKPDWQKWLLLIPPGERLKLNSISLLSEVSKTYAPPGQVLISASVVGNLNVPSAVQIRDEIIHISRKKLDLRHLHTDTIHHALPVMRKELGKEFLFQNGIYQCGDHLSTPSLNGALRSGRLAGLDINLREE